MTYNSYMKNRGRFWDLLVASFGALFFEMVLVRWLPTTIYYLGYYKNCILFATFVGFGCGAATRRRVDRTLPYFGFGVAVMVLAAVLTERYTQIVPIELGEFVWPKVSAEAGGIALPFLVPLLLVFATSALLMVPLGRLVGEHLDAFPPITGYSINIAASLCGVFSFLALSYLSFEPPLWFAIAAMPLLYFVRANRVHVGCSLAGLLLTVGILEFAHAPREFWSPYSKITLSDAQPGVNVRLLSTNNNGHQVLYDLSPARMASRGGSKDPAWDFAEMHRYMYESAYAVVHPRSVLVVGGGTGNETAAALRHGVERVDVVDIDPTIIRLGRMFHPEQPYRDSRVRIINDDARHYMTTTDQRYDLIIFGFLDSTSHLSSMSNIRLDNYVYTVESFRRARALLSPNGLLEVTYYALADYVRLRIFLMIENAFEQTPLIAQIKTPPTPDVFFFAGPAVAKMSTLSIPGMVQGTYKRDPQSAAPLTLATDDWPYLNTRSKTVSTSYILGLGSMILVSVVFIGFFVTFGAGPVSKNSTAFCFFLQGAGFMLIETNTITRMALILGSTWVVTSLAVALVLLAGLVSNFVIQRFRFPSVAVSIGLVAAATLLNYFVDIHFYLGLAGSLRVLLAALQLYLPILASSFVFGRLFQHSDRSSYDLGMNILGAMFGGMLEYSSLIIGTSAVYLVALAVFLAIAPLYRGALHIKSH